MSGEGYTKAVEAIFERVEAERVAEAERREVVAPKQRARQATEPEYLEALARARLNKAIERAIVAAVEEDRASRECCKAKFAETREACAKIADEEYIRNMADDAARLALANVSSEIRALAE